MRKRGVGRELRGRQTRGGRETMAFTPPKAEGTVLRRTNWKGCRGLGALGQECPLLPPP